MKDFEKLWMMLYPDMQINHEWNNGAGDSCYMVGERCVPMPNYILCYWHANSMYLRHDHGHYLPGLQYTSLLGACKHCGSVFNLKSRV